MSSSKSALAFDPSTHLSTFGRSLKANALATLGSDLTDCISLGGGNIHPQLFPMRDATFTIPALESLTGDIAPWKRGTASVEEIKMVKSNTEGTDGASKRSMFDLKDVLHYPSQNGFAALQQSLAKVNQALHQPARSDLRTYITLANLDALSKIVQIVLEPGIDTVLVERYCYAGALHNFRSRGIRTYPVRADPHGMDPTDLRRVLEEWDESDQGRRPHVLYIIPGGQNPTGSLIASDRRQAIYELCRIYNILIIEDDLYCHLQYSPYITDTAQREMNMTRSISVIPPPLDSPSDEDTETTAQAWRKSVTPTSFQSLDSDGRVIRCDSFSKMLGPGYRTGWITCHPIFYERLLRIAEISTQSTNNFSQAILASYLSDEHWGIGGFIRWLWGMRLEYQQKRDFFIDSLNSSLEPELASFAIPGAGIYLWVKIQTDKHPRYTGSNTQDLMDELWQFLVEEGKVIVIPGKLFVVAKPNEDAGSLSSYLRLCFSEDRPQLHTGATSFARSISRFFQQANGH